MEPAEPPPLPPKMSKLKNRNVLLQSETCLKEPYLVNSTDQSLSTNPIRSPTSSPEPMGVALNQGLNHCKTPEMKPAEPPPLPHKMSNFRNGNVPLQSETCLKEPYLLNSTDQSSSTNPTRSPPSSPEPMGEALSQGLNHCKTPEMEPAEPPPLPPKRSNLRISNVPLQRTYTLRDFTLNLEPINLLEEILTGPEWEKYLPVRDSRVDSHDQSQINPQPQTTEAPSVSSDRSGVADEVTRSQEGTLPIFAIDKNILQNGVNNAAALSEEPHDLFVVYVSAGEPSVVDGSALKNKFRDPPKKTRNSEKENEILKKTTMVQVDQRMRSVSAPSFEYNIGSSTFYTAAFIHFEDPASNNLLNVKPSYVLDNSALKSRIRLSKTRKHRPPGKKNKMTGVAGDQRDRSFSAPIIINTSPDHAGIIGTPKPAAGKPSYLLDNSALKSRIRLSKTRKHRPPGKKNKKKSEGSLSSEVTHHEYRGRSSSSPLYLDAHVYPSSVFYPFARPLSS